MPVSISLRLPEATAKALDELASATERVEDLSYSEGAGSLYGGVC
jgi:predicted transcriptional regulator